MEDVNILKNISNNFELKNPKNYYYNIVLPIGTLVKVKNIDVQSKTVIFTLSLDNDIDSLTQKLMDFIIESTKKTHDDYISGYHKVIKEWKESPDSFKFVEKKFDNELIYKSTKKILSSDEYYATGWGVNTYYDLKFYEDALKNSEDALNKDIKKIYSETSKYKKELMKYKIEIPFSDIELEIKNSNIKLYKKSIIKKDDIVFNADFLNCFLDEYNDVVISEEIIQYAIDDEIGDGDDINTLKKLIGWSIDGDTDDYHENDGDYCEYTVTLTSPEGVEYYAYDSHCLVTGWDFVGKVEFE